MSRCPTPPLLPDNPTEAQRAKHAQVVYEWRLCKAGEREDKIYGRVKEDTEKRLDREDARQQAILNAQSENQRRQLDFQRQVHQGDLAFRQSTLQLQRQRARDESVYRNRLLDSQNRQAAADRAERARVHSETVKMNKLQLQQQKEQFDKTFAFNKERAAENDKRRIQADRLAEEGARRQVLSSLGYHDQKSKVGSPLQALTLNLQRQRRNRPRLNTV